MFEFKETENDILLHGFEEFRKYINPMIAQRAALAKEPVRIIRTENGLLYDERGRSYEDFHGTQCFNHKNQSVIQAIKDFLDSEQPSWFPSRVSPYAGRLAKKLIEMCGGEFYSQVYFAMSGSDAVEAAVKLARAASGKREILYLEGAYHGCGLGSTAFMHKGYLRDSFGELLPGAKEVAFNNVEDLRSKINDKTAAVIVEPIQGEGGVRSLSPEFIVALCSLTEEFGVLLIADEIQTGFGRTGTFLNTSDWPRRPDAVLLAKALGGGLIPISACITHMRFFKKAYGSSFASGESHNSTFSFNSLSAVAGLAATELLSEDLMTRVLEKGKWFKEYLHKTLQDCELFDEVRGTGMMLGIKIKDFTNPMLSFEHFNFPGLKDKSAGSPLLCMRLFKKGFFCFTCGHDWSIFRLQPRFDIPRESLEYFAECVRDELNWLAEL